LKLSKKFKYFGFFKRINTCKQQKIYQCQKQIKEEEEKKNLVSLTVIEYRNDREIKKIILLGFSFFIYRGCEADDDDDAEEL
jgi:hypothetical protein